MNTNTKTRVALYMRADKDEQLDSSYNLRFQEKRLRQFINSQHDVTLDNSHIYKDNDLSGILPIESRPALKKLFEDGANKKFDAVYICRLDRFFQKTSLLLDGVEKLKKLNIQFKSVTDYFDLSTSTGMFFLTIIGNSNELKANIKNRQEQLDE